MIHLLLTHPDPRANVMWIRLNPYLLHWLACNQYLGSERQSTFSVSGAKQLPSCCRHAKPVLLKIIQLHDLNISSGS